MSGLLVAALASCATPQRDEVTRELYLMGTTLTVHVEGTGSRHASLAASEWAVVSLEQSAQRLTTWDASGELAQHQRGAAAASPRLRRELNEALAWAERSNGAFEPRCGALVAAWDLRGSGRVPSASERAAAAADRSLWDEGGWGKGAALAALLEDMPPTDPSFRLQVDLGGQWLLHGPGSFVVHVAHPDRREELVARLELEACSVATSGNSERAIEINGQRYGHVLDPRTGDPAPDFGSVTVVHRSPFAADALATAFLVLGPQAALQWAARDPETEVLILKRTPDGVQAIASEALEAKLTLFLE